MSEKLCGNQQTSQAKRNIIRISEFYALKIKIFTNRNQLIIIEVKVSEGANVLMI